MITSSDIKWMIESEGFTTIEYYNNSRTEFAVEAISGGASYHSGRRSSELGAWQALLQILRDANQI